MSPDDRLQGTLDLLILGTLMDGPLHGWAISRRIRERSGEVLQVNQGSLYPALHRLEDEHWLVVAGELKKRRIVLGISRRREAVTVSRRKIGAARE